MCYIRLIGASAGGIVARRYYYDLNLQRSNGKVVFSLSDGTNNIKKFIDKNTFDTIGKYVLNKLKTIPNSGEGHDSAYSGLELTVHCKNFKWSNEGPGGCVHMGVSFKPTLQQQKVYDEIVAYLKNFADTQK
jgi:hypothetical protein